jgi:hypothetical protein
MTFESLKTKKFDMSNLGRVKGGDTTYGTTKATTNGHDAGYDWRRVTYNPPGYPEGTQGWDPSTQDNYNKGI